MSRPRVLFASPGRNACTQILEQPFRLLERRGSIDLAVHFDNETDPDVSVRRARELAHNADVLFLFRSHELSSLSLLREARLRGTPVIWSTDDDLLRIDPESPCAVTYRDPEVVDAMRNMVREADRVWLFTDEMVHRYKSLNGRTILGALPAPLGPAPIRSDPLGPSRRPLRIGYPGDFTHALDLEAVVEALGRVLDHYGSTVRAVFVGYLPEVFRDDRRVEHIPYFSSLEAYYDFMRSDGWSIGLAPLLDRPFNRGKTNNKYREYAAFGIPGIYSDMPVYRPSVRHGETGWLTEHTSQGFEASLHRLILDRNVRESIRAAAWNDAADHYTVEAMARQFLDVVTELTSAPRQGVPSGLRAG